MADSGVPAVSPSLAVEVPPSAAVLPNATLVVSETIALSDKELNEAASPRIEEWKARLKIECLELPNVTTRIRAAVDLSRGQKQFKNKPIQCVLTWATPWIVDRIVIGWFIARHRSALAQKLPRRFGSDAEDYLQEVSRWSQSNRPSRCARSPKSYEPCDHAALEKLVFRKCWNEHKKKWRDSEKSAENKKAWVEADRGPTDLGRTAAKRDRKEDLRRILPNEDGRDQVDPNPTPRSCAVATEQRELLRKAIERLPEELRQVVNLMIEYARVSHQQIAAALEISDDQALDRWRKALKRLAAMNLSSREGKS